MPEQFPPRWRPIPVGFLGALALVIGVERFIDRHGESFLSGNQRSAVAVAQAADRDARDCQVLCFGDSLMKLGVAPTILERAGFRAYNLAMAGGQAPGHYFLLRRALASGARPRAILVDFFPKLMAEPAQYNVESLPDLADFADVAGLAHATGDARFLADLALRMLVPSVRCREAIRFRTSLVLQGASPILTNEIRKAVRNWRVNRGAEISPSRLDNPTPLDSWVAGYFPSFACSAVNYGYIEGFLDLADRHAIPVFWVLPPYRPDLLDRCQAHGFIDQHQAFVRGLQARHRNLVVIDAARARYEPTVFFDYHHLGSDGAAIFTESVARFLRRRLDQPASADPARWVTLDRADGPLVATPLETTVESAQVVLRQAAARSNNVR